MRVVDVGHQRQDVSQDLALRLDEEPAESLGVLSGTAGDAMGSRAFIVKGPASPKM